MKNRIKFATWKQIPIFIYLRDAGMDFTMPTLRVYLTENQYDFENRGQMSIVLIRSHQGD